jgi:hypothetical protein
VIYDVAVPISPDDYAELEGVPFTDVSALTEWSKTNPAQGRAEVGGAGFVKRERRDSNPRPPA